MLAASCSDGRVGGTDGSGQGSGNGSPQADDDAQQTGDRDDSGSDDSSSSSDDDATGNGSGGSAASGGGAASDGNNSGESNGSGQSSSMGGSTSNGGSGSDTTNGDGTAASNRTDGTDGNSDTAPLVDCDTPGPRLIRRLTAKQFDNTLDALVGQGAPDEVVLSDPAVLGFTVDADAALVSDLTAEQLMNHAERVSAWVVENQPWEVSSCTSHDENCHRQFIEEFGRRAFRRDPTPEQMNTYLDMFAAEQSFEAGLYVVLATMLQSPYLLYRRELGEPDPGNSGQYILTPYEIATQLSYFLTDSPPDQQLLDAAAQNRLQSADEIDQQVYRLLSQPEAQEALANFVHGWLEVDGLFKKAKDPAVYDLTEPMRQAMLDQTRHFFFELFQSGGSIGDLFGADFTMVNQPLAELYGLGGVGGDAFSRVSLEGTQRATGVLGHAAFLSEHALPDNSSPVQRGVIV